MTEPLPDLVTKVKGDVSDLIAAIAEAKAAMKSFQDESEKTTQKRKSDNDKSSQSEKDFARLVVGNIKTESNALKDLQRAFDETRVKRDALRAEFARGGNTNIFGDLKSAESDLSKLSGYIKDMGGDTQNVSRGFGTWLGELSGAAPIIAGIVAALAPLAGGIAAGGILAAVGGGGIAAGIAGQLHSSQVQSALGDFKAEIKTAFTDATSAFAPATARALETVAGGTAQFLGGLKPAFAVLAPYLDKFASALAQAEQELLPGLSKGLEAAGPLIGVIADMLPGLATAIGDFFAELSDGSQGAAEGLRGLFYILDGAIVVIGGLLDGLAHVLDWTLHAIQIALSAAIAMEAFFGRVSAPLDNLYGAVSDVRAGVDSLAASTEDANTATANQVGVVGQLTYAYDSLSAALTKYTSQTQKTDDMNLAMHRDLLAFHTELKKGAKNWDENTKAGQKNVELLDQVNKGITDYYDSLRVNGNLTPAQTKAELDELISQRNLAKAYGATADELSSMDGEIGLLKAALLGLPKERTVKINVHTTYQSDGTSILSGMGRPNGGRGGAQGAGANSGIVGQLPSFGSSGVFQGGPEPIYRFAEQSVGKEALIAQRGDKNRALSTLAEAAGWFADDINRTVNYNISAGGGGGGGMCYGVANVILDGKVIARALIQPVNRMNGRSSTSVYGAH